MEQQPSRREHSACDHEQMSGSASTLETPAPVLRVTRRAADRLRGGHLWVYRADIESRGSDHASADLEPGSLITVVDSRGLALGSATYSTTSTIAARLISRDPGLTRAAYLDILRERISEAITLRDQLAPITPDNDARRLLFSEADGVPGIIADQYGPLTLVQLLTQGTAADDVRAVLAETLPRAGPAHLATSAASTGATIWERTDPRVRELEQLGPTPAAPIYTTPGAAPQTTALFHLNGLAFHYDATAGQKTGAFLDQRLNYAAAAANAHGRALDVFTYQGGFALHLARRCDGVTGVDTSRAALEVADRNFEQNRTALAAEIDWIEADAFELLRAWDGAGERFDTIVLDPPAFAKSSRATEGALRGYKELNLRALRMLRPGGTLVTCSCSHHVSLEQFTAVLGASATDSGRRVQLLEVRGAAPDHPAILTLPETSYLKCLICRVS